MKIPNNKEPEIKPKCMFCENPSIYTVIRLSSVYRFIPVCENHMNVHTKDYVIDNKKVTFINTKKQKPHGLRNDQIRKKRSG